MEFLCYHRDRPASLALRHELVEAPTGSVHISSRPSGTWRSAGCPVPRPSTKYRLPPVRPPEKSHMVRPSALRHRQVDD